MQLEALTAISPIDGRYRSQLEHLSKYFSEYALIKYRVKIEVEYFIALSDAKIFSLDEGAKASLQNIVESFSIANAEKIKATEKITNHDVKAVEYFLKEKLVESGQTALQEWIHFGLTSQDINNTAFPLLWKDALQQEYIPS
jgi:adenylosuccinate lyase